VIELRHLTPLPACRSLTAAECITYSAALRLDPRLPASAVQRRVWEVLKELGLQDVAGAWTLAGMAARVHDLGVARGAAACMHAAHHQQLGPPRPTEQ
jgi:hypothetical protein